MCKSQKNRWGNFFKRTSVISFILCIALLITSAVYSIYLPNELSINGEYKENNNLNVKLRYDNKNADTKDSSVKNTVTALLFNIVPIKEIPVNTVEKEYFTVCGNPFGIKLYSKGALIVDTSEIICNGKKYYPSKDAGIQKGDIIESVNGESINSNEELINKVNESNGNPIKIVLSRKGETITTTVKPIKDDSSNAYKIGVWVKDSLAGIGTLTFYDSQTGCYAALGHAVCETDTGIIMKISGGTPAHAEVDSIVKSTKGNAGCLKGHLTGNIDGTIEVNNEKGLFGYMNEKPESDLQLELGYKQDIKVGKAKVLTTIDGNKPKYYDIEIESINYNNEECKNMVIKVTDKELLSKTGGIVQGMSGSPIVQDNKLIGAVTHVFLNDPQRGYAIFAETMNEEMKKITTDSTFAEVS